MLNCFGEIRPRGLEYTWDLPRLKFMPNLQPPVAQDDRRLTGLTHLETQFHSWASESPYILMTEGGGQIGELTLLGHRMGSSFLPAFSVHNQREPLSSQPFSHLHPSFHQFIQTSVLQ